MAPLENTGPGGERLASPGRPIDSLMRALLYVDTQGTGKVDERKLEKALSDIFPLRPTNIRRGLQLNKPIYKRTAAYGHFGRKPDRDGGFSWERLDLVPELKRAFHAR